MTGRTARYTAIGQLAGRLSQKFAGQKVAMLDWYAVRTRNACSIDDWRMRTQEGRTCAILFPLLYGASVEKSVGASDADAHCLYCLLGDKNSEGMVAEKKRCD